MHVATGGSGSMAMTRRRLFTAASCCDYCDRRARPGAGGRPAGCPPRGVSPVLLSPPEAKILQSDPPKTQFYLYLGGPYLAPISLNKPPTAQASH